MKHRAKSTRKIAARGRKAGRSAGRTYGTNGAGSPTGASQRTAPGSRTRAKPGAKAETARSAAAAPLPEGAVITRVYKGREIRVTVLAEGFRCDGEVFRSLTAVALRVTGYPAISGPHFFRVGGRAPATPKAARLRGGRNSEDATSAPTGAPVDADVSAG